MKKLILLFTMCGFLIFNGCKKEHLDNKVELRSSGSWSAKKSLPEANVIYTDFKINIREIELDIDDDMVVGDDTIFSDVKFKGPFELNLLEDGTILDRTIATVDIPINLYKEIEFKLHKGNDLPASDSLYNRSIYIAGTIDGVPFVMWHDTDEEFEIPIGNQIAQKLDSGEELILTILFNLNQLENALHNVDLGNASDGNEDGIIIIGPDNIDGNKSISEQLKENLEAVTDLIDDNK